MGKRGKTPKRTAFEIRVRETAARVFKNAVRSGRLVRPQWCARCLCEGAVVGHHEDYSRPLWVTWLCTVCHAHRHQELERQGYDLFHGVRFEDQVRWFADKYGVSKHWLLTGEPAEAAA